MRIEQTFAVGRRPGEVFGFMARPENLDRWQTIKTYVTPISEGEPRLGYRVKEGNEVGPRQWDQVVEFTEFEPGRVLKVAVVEGPASWGRWTFEPDDAGTRVVFECEAELPRLLAPLLTPVARRQWRRFHENLRREVENDGAEQRRG